MSRAGDWFDEHAAKLETWAKELLGHADPAMKAMGEDVSKEAAAIRAEVPVVEHEAAADAAQVAKDAEVAAKPLVAEAENDAATVAAEAVTDVAKAAGA